MSFLDITTSLFLGGKFHTIAKFWKFLCHKFNGFFQKKIKKIKRRSEKNLHISIHGSSRLVNNIEGFFCFFSFHIFLIGIFGSIGL
jgi:hypothetical protein